MKQGCKTRKNKNKIHVHIILQNLSFGCIPIVNSTGSEVRVEDSDDGRRGVSQNRIVDDIQEVNQLEQFAGHEVNLDFIHFIWLLCVECAFYFSLQSKWFNYRFNYHIYTFCRIELITVM